MSCTTACAINDVGGNNGGTLLPCTSYDYQLCEDDTNFQSRSNNVSSSSGIIKSLSTGIAASSHHSWVTNLKYVIGGLFQVASFIMFTGILFTNRRRHRAIMMRKYRQAKRRSETRVVTEVVESQDQVPKKRSKSKSRDKASEGSYKWRFRHEERSPWTL
jgi:hypothetical protein